jgi:FKBP-type peptidyl-prolyl cis-trans isomerase
VAEIKDTSASDLENALLPPAPEPPASPPSGCPEAQIMKTWGWSVARALRPEKSGLSGDELAWFTSGLMTGISGGQPPADMARIYPLVRQTITDHREKVRAAIKKKQMDDMEALFAKLKQNTNVMELPDGLRYEIVQSGSGPNPKTGQIVLVDYTGRLLDGTIFDQTYNEPLHIQVGLVIAGWNEGIQKINRGGKIRLYVPPSLGYGDEDHSGVVTRIPANSTLIYDITLLEIQDAGEKAPEPH